MQLDPKILHFTSWAIIVPMANEANEFKIFTKSLIDQLDTIIGGTVYLVVDQVSVDNTYILCQELSNHDSRFKTIWASENKCIVDAYIRGYKEAFIDGHELFIEMDAGMSHDPKSLPMFLQELNKDIECVFGSRFIKGGSMGNSPFFRKVLSRVGTILSNLFLGTNMHDMTSGYQGFQRNIVAEILKYKLISKAHFYQTEVRYLLRKRRFCEIPIHYYAPSPRVKLYAIKDSILVFLIYIFKRLSGKGMAL